MELNNLIATSLFSEPMKQLLVQAVTHSHQGMVKLEKDGGRKQQLMNPLEYFTEGLWQKLNDPRVSQCSKIFSAGSCSET